MSNQPRRAPEASPIPDPQDVDFPGLLLLDVDVTDVTRRIFRARQTIPVSESGTLTLLYPKWLPGYHSPHGAIELFAGLTINGGGKALSWARHPVEVNAFQVAIPEGLTRIEAEFQYLSPTNTAQGDVVVTPDMLILRWNNVLLYPAGYYSRCIMVRPRLTLPEGWRLASSLHTAASEERTIEFQPTRLDILVDSPVIAGRHHRRIDLDGEGGVHLNLFADDPDLLGATDDQVDLHRNIVEQADRLFGNRPFQRFEILMTLSEEITNNGVEHHSCCEVLSVPDYFTNWSKNIVKRDTIPHEFSHAWNGKYRRGADSWTPVFQTPIRNSLLWVYEGQTQYWTNVLCARSGLWTSEQALQAIALTAAIDQLQSGSRWRSMSDTTRDPIIAGRCPLPWPSWQRSEDYYSEGSLVWLDVDTRIRELSGETLSLDDFARRFFSARDGGAETLPYEFSEVVRTLDELAPFDWAGFFIDKLEAKRGDAPLGGLGRGGYRLAFRSTPGSYLLGKEKIGGATDLTFSIGVRVSTSGAIDEVIWESPAFEAGLTNGATIRTVNGEEFGPDILKDAIARSAESGKIELGVSSGIHSRTATIIYDGGLRYPYLEPVPGAIPRLDSILAPRGRTATL